MNVRIDFIAGHQLQARAGDSVFAALSERVECRWRIGRGIEPEGAQAVVLLDHTQQSPAVIRPGGWRWRFYLMHDLGDVMAYKLERRALRKFSMVIVPDMLHARYARRYLRWRTKVRVGGWPKYDHEGISPEFANLKQDIAALPKRPTILYAPTWAGRDEWRTLLPRLAHLPFNVIVKNHTYATLPGEKVSAIYQSSRLSIIEMEHAALDFIPAMIVAPAELNICTLFPYVDAVITDQSSVAAEFLPWGLAVETGANLNGKPEIGTSRWYPEVVYLPLESLMSDLANDGQKFIDRISTSRFKTTQTSVTGAGKLIADMIWQEMGLQEAHNATAIDC
jgi:hypothetical protein